MVLGANRTLRVRREVGPGILDMPLPPGVDAVAGRVDQAALF